MERFFFILCWVLCVAGDGENFDSVLRPQTSFYFLSANRGSIAGVPNRKEDEDSSSMEDNDDSAESSSSEREYFHKLSPALPFDPAMPLSFSGQRYNSNPIIGRDPFQYPAQASVWTDYFLKREGIICQNEASNETGICYPETLCLTKEGKGFNSCGPFSPHTCCIFRMTCDSTTTEINSYFRNRNFPNQDEFLGQCKFSVSKNREDICGLRVEIASVSKINNELRFEVSAGTGKAAYEPVRLEEGKIYIVNFDSNNLEFSVEADTSYRIAWKISISQLTRCSSISGAELWPVAPVKQGAVDVSPSPVPESIPPVLPQEILVQVTVTNETVPEEPIIEYVNFAKSPCGIAGKKFKRGFGVRNEIDEKDKEIEEETIGNSVSPLEWGGPDLSSSVFYKYTKGLKVNNRITFGKFVGKNQYPWQVSVERQNGNVYKYHCGASVINECYVVTAAHCVREYRNKVSKLRFGFGDHLIGTENDFINIYVDAAKIYDHKGFSYRYLTNDIGLVKLKHNLTFSERIQPVCIPLQGSEPDNQLQIVTGWGRDEKQRLRKELMMLTAGVVENTECNSKWKRFSGNINLISDKMLCLNTQNGDSCKGDSGGPCFSCNIVKGKNICIQNGIVSFGSTDCVSSYYPGVYTKVSAYTNWIKGIIDNDPC